MLFKGAEMRPSLTEDRGLSAKRRTNPVGFYISQGIYLPRFSYVRDLSFHAINRTGWRQRSRSIAQPPCLKIMQMLS